MLTEASCKSPTKLTSLAKSACSSARCTTHFDEKRGGQDPYREAALVKSRVAAGPAEAGRQLVREGQKLVGGNLGSCCGHLCHDVPVSTQAEPHAAELEDGGQIMRAAGQQAPAGACIAQYAPEDSRDELTCCKEVILYCDFHTTSTLELNGASL